MAAIDLTTLADLKAWLDIPTNVGTDDAMLALLITNVSQAMLTKINSPGFVSVSYTEKYDGSGTPIQALRQVPVTAVTSLAINTMAILASPDGVQSGFTFDRWSVKLAGTPAIFASGYQNIAITYTAGYAAVPGDIAEAAKEWCAVRYRARKWIGQTSKHLNTGETVSFSQKAMPDFVVDTLKLYQRYIPV